MTTHNIIIGGGPAATNAVETIREFDSGVSKITLISDEPAHSRMALPYWLAGNILPEQTHTGDNAYFLKLRVETKFGTRVTKVDPQAKQVTLTSGESLTFDNLLIATGSSPLKPAIPGSDLPGAQPLWSLAHTESVLKTAAALAPSGKVPRVVLVGAGFIGFIVLNAMYKKGWKLAVVERESQVLPRMLDAASAGFVKTWLGTKQVDVHCGTSVQAIETAADGSKNVKLANGQTLSADLVIMAVGIRPNLDLIAGAGLTTGEGIQVNDRMQSSVPFIYAAGDVAQGPQLLGGPAAIHAIQPTAVDHGRVAGANMAGHEIHYPGSLLMNVVDVCGLQTVSYGNWNDAAAEATTISNGTELIYRKLLWTGDRLTGAIFTGRPNDVGMLTDIGMVKGIMQTRTALGSWKKYLQENPFDVRRAYVGAGVAQQLINTTLLGQPAKARQFHYGGGQLDAAVGKAHAVYVGSKS